jgi:hypothetical protein
MDRLWGEPDQNIRTGVAAIYAGYLIALIVASAMLEITFSVLTVCLGLHFVFLFGAMVGSKWVPEWWPYDAETTGEGLIIVLKVWDTIQFVVMCFSIYVVASDHETDNDIEITCLIVAYIGVFLCFLKFIRQSKFFEGNSFIYGFE